MLPACGLRFDGMRFWVVHRHREYGPFDYEWSGDLCGMEMTFQGQKFGEYCSEDELFADLKPFKLPMRVAQVSTVIMGTQFYCVLNGYTEVERRDEVIRRLAEFGFSKYAGTIVDLA